MLYVDEEDFVTYNGLPVLGQKACASRGASRDVGMIVGTQRGIGIPRIIITQSTLAYTFGIPDADDRKMVARRIGFPDHRIGALQQYEFLAGSMGERTCGDRSESQHSM